MNVTFTDLAVEVMPDGMPHCRGTLAQPGSCSCLSVRDGDASPQICWHATAEGFCKVACHRAFGIVEVAVNATDEWEGVDTIGTAVQDALVKNKLKLREV